MGKFTGAYITNTGKEMLFGSKNLTYTKVILYDQDLSQTAIDQVRALTSLDNPLLTTQIGLADTKSDQVIVEATFKNDRVNQDINFKSVGWYAKTDTRPESLIAVSVIDGVKTLGANSPDQVSTSSINLKLAMAIDDATTVTTQINPAGTITPAQLDSAVSNAKQELNASLKAQADKANSELTSANNELTKKLNKAIDDTNASLTTKADKVDVDQALSTKADKTEVNNQLNQKANASDVNRALDNKADKSNTYTKAQVDDRNNQLEQKLDAKISGKDTEDTITVVTGYDPATKSATKENRKSHDAWLVDQIALGKIADALNSIDGNRSINSAVDVNTVQDYGAYKLTNQGNTNTPPWLQDKRGQLYVFNYDGNAKTQIWIPVGSGAYEGNIGYRYWEGNNVPAWIKIANSSDITNAMNLAKQAQSTASTKANASDLSALQNSALQLINGNSGDDILSFRDEKIRRYSNVSNVKNLPSMANSSWFYVVTHTSQGWGNVTVISQDNCYWQNSLNGNAWTGWVKHTTSTDVTNLQNQINAKLNFVRQDAATAIVHDFPTNINDLDKLPEGRYNTRNLSPDAWNAIKNRPDIDKYGMIICYREEADGWQLAFSTNHPTTMYFRGAGGATYSPWQKLEQVDVSGLLAKITDAKNTATQASQKADNANNNANGRLPLSGGNMNLRSVINWNGGGINDRTGNLGGITWNGGTDNARIYGDQDGNDNLDLAFDLGDDGSNHFSFRKNGQEIAMIGLNGHFTGTVDWDHINGKPSFNNPELESKINNVQNIANSANSKVDTLNSAFAVHKYSNAVNLNDLWSTWGISYLLNSNNTNTPSFISDKRGTLFTFSFDGNGKWQLFAGCISGLAYRSYLSDGNTWHRLVDERDVTSLQNQINDLRNQINQLKSTIPQIRRFNNENDARNWEGNDPNKIAVVE